MTLLALGINHNTASVALRERVGFSPNTFDQALSSLLGQPLVQGGVVLSTCNRTELYLSVEQQANLKEAAVCWLYDSLQLEQDQVCQSLYWYLGDKAISHFMGVVSGLDSLLLSAPQILGQVKKAFTDSWREHGLSVDRSDYFRNYSPLPSECAPKPKSAHIRFRWRLPSALWCGRYLNPFLR